jgi:anthranilate/para-aminobenzoate synthase component I
VERGPADCAVLLVERSLSVCPAEAASLRLLDIAESLPPPFALLEDGRGPGVCALLWGPSDRLRVEWPSAAVGSLEQFSWPSRYVGAVAYDLGLPPKARRREPVVRQPLADLFQPTQRIVLRSGAAEPELVGGEARMRWREGLGSWPRPAAFPRSQHRDRGARVPARSFDREEFEAVVRRALDYIAAGDIYQVNLSVAECVPLEEPPLAVYRRLRAINPSPFMGYCDFGDWQLVCGSPELLVEVRGGVARAGPIAGTRKRTGDVATDEAMRRELVTDAKESAEHVMLVDLARNDLGRVAAYGSVHVARFGAVEAYSHVMHLVSDVRARLLPGAAPLDLFRAMFPGGTITGTPKIRAMEIIAELEPVARGMYTGALGWVEADAAQWNILIRSAVVSEGQAVIQAGAGIVADSDPTREWKESLRKAAALREALGIGG